MPRNTVNGHGGSTSCDGQKGRSELLGLGGGVPKGL